MERTRVARRTLDEVLERTEEIATSVVAPAAAAVDRDCAWPEAALRALQDAGLGGLVAPADFGGCGHGALALARVCERLGRECASTAICFGMHCVGTAVMASQPTADQSERFLAPISEGRHLTTLSLSEAGTGAHFYFPETRLAAGGDSFYEVSGTKTFVTNGGYADSYVVSVVDAGSGADSGNFSCVVVPADAEGITWGDPWAGLGMRGNSSRSMTLDCTRIPRSNLLGREGDEIWYAFNVVAPYFLVAMAGTYLGVATAALAEARNHLMRRRHTHTGLALSGSPLLQHRVGTLWSNVERTRQLVYGAARAFDAGEANASIAVMAAKAEVADCVVAVVNEAMTLCGGIAYRDNALLHKLFRDARAAHVMSPTTDILRTWIGRQQLEHPLLGD